MIFSILGLGSKKHEVADKNNAVKVGDAKPQVGNVEGARRATDAVLLLEQNNAERSLLIIDCNPYIKNVLGFTKNELAGKDFRTICGSDLVAKIDDELEFRDKEKDFRDIAKQIGEFVLVNKANMNIPAEMRVNRVLSVTGHEHYQVTISDNSINDILLANRMISDSVNAKISIYDEVTGLPNKNTFLRDLDVVTYYSRNNDSPLSAMFLAVNNAVDIKNKHGRDEYNKIITEVAEIAKETLRTEDIAGVISEDIMGFIMYQTAADSVDTVVERLFEILSNYYFETSNGKAIETTFSCLFCDVHKDTFTEGLVENCLARITTLKNRDSFQKEFMIEQ